MLTDGSQRRKSNGIYKRKNPHEEENIGPQTKEKARKKEEVMPDPIKNNLTIALAIIFVGGGCLGWIGTRTLDYAFSDLRDLRTEVTENTSEIKHNRTDINKLEGYVKDLALMKEMVIRIDERTAGWEPDAE